MGITMNSIHTMAQKGLFGNGGINVLDIGSSNLYSADQEAVEGFITKYSKQYNQKDLKSISERLAAGSAYVEGRGGLNEAFVGELFEQAGMEYTSIDIAYGYKTLLLDLNHSPLPSQFFQKFDLVLNFGTTEHILDQYNSFKIIHEATKVGGFMYHQLPSSGFVDHGYFVYTGRFFFDLAGFNGYEIVGCWFDGPSGEGDVLESIRSYQAYFPALRNTLQVNDRGCIAAALEAARIPNTSINVIFKKVNAKSFLDPLETSTSVGEMASSFSSSDNNESRKSSGSSGGVTSAEFAAVKVAVATLQMEMKSLKGYLSVFKIFRPLLKRMKRFVK